MNPVVSIRQHIAAKKQRRRQDMPPAWTSIQTGASKVIITRHDNRPAMGMMLATFPVWSSRVMR